MTSLVHFYIDRTILKRNSKTGHLENPVFSIWLQGYQTLNQILSHLHCLLTPQLAVNQIYLKVQFPMYSLQHAIPLTCILYSI